MADQNPHPPAQHDLDEPDGFTDTSDPSWFYYADTTGVVRQWRGWDLRSARKHLLHRMVTVSAIETWGGWRDIPAPGPPIS